jgi:hypothetical protein
MGDLPRRVGVTRKGRKNISRHNDWKYPKFDERWTYITKKLNDLQIGQIQKSTMIYVIVSQKTRDSWKQQEISDSSHKRAPQNCRWNWDIPKKQELREFIVSRLAL